MAKIFTPKQARFIAEYLVDGNGTRAAMAAGYARAGSRVTACRLLTKANVQAALKARQTADATRLELSRERVVAGLLEAVESGRQLGQPIAMVAALREIGKLMGFYPAASAELKIDHRIGADQRRLLKQLNSASDAELLAIIGGGSVALGAP